MKKKEVHFLKKFKIGLVKNERFEKIDQKLRLCK